MRSVDINSNIVLWNSDCTKNAAFTPTFDTATGKVTIVTTDLVGTYIVSVKYDSSSLVGQAVGIPLPTNVYTFTTDIDGTTILSSPDSISVQPKK